MSEIYCGVGDVPKNKVRGTFKECLEKNQIRYYGAIAIKPEKLKKALKEKIQKKNAPTLKKLEVLLEKRLIKMKMLEFKIKGIKKKYKNEKKIDEKKKIKKKHNELFDEWEEVKNLYEKTKKQISVKENEK